MPGAEQVQSNSPWRGRMARFFAGALLEQSQVEPGAEEKWPSAVLKQVPAAQVSVIPLLVHVQSKAPRNDVSSRTETSLLVVPEQSQVEPGISNKLDAFETDYWG